jgi:hypothetical protein
LLNIIIIVRKTFAKAAEKSKEEVFVHFPSLLSFSKLKRAETTTAKFVAPKEVQEYIYVGHRARFIPKIIIICFS